MKRDLTKPEADDAAAFSLPALFGRGMDAAKEGFAKFPGPFFPSPLFPGAFGKDLFAKDLPIADLPTGDLPAGDLITKDPGLSVKGPRPEAGKPIFFPGALPAASQKLVTDFRAYSGIRHREAVPFGEPVVLGRLGALEVRLARTAGDVRRAQRLRYKVFYEEMSAVPDTPSRLARRDFDAFDAVCEHILVLDHDAGKIVLGRRKPKVVGTYRLLRQEVANRHGGFYTASEFDVGRVVDGHPSLKFLELGRSCVLKPYRNKRTVELLWHGIWTYVLRNKIDAMLGCASLEGTDPDALALPLSFLHHNALAPEEWRGRALPSRYVEMNRMPAEAISPKAALQSLPPLVKGYLRLGGFVGEGAVTDHQFGTTDVLVVLPVSVISPRYVEHFGPTANRHAI